MYSHRNTDYQLAWKIFSAKITAMFLPETKHLDDVVDKTLASGVSAFLLKKYASSSMVRRYPPNPRDTKNVFSDSRVLSIQIYVL